MSNCCRNCGASLSPNARYCRRCGYKLETTSSLPPGQSAPPAERGAQARPRTPPSQRRPYFPLLALLLGGVFLLCCGGLAAGYFILSPELPFGRAITQAEPARVSTQPQTSGEGTASALGAYLPRKAAPGDTTPETAQGVTSATPTTITLSDGTQVRLPPSASQVQVTLARADNTIQLSDQPALRTSGAMRTLEFDPAAIDENFVPVLTIPAGELGELDPVTVNVARVGDIQLEGETLHDQVMFLPITRDPDGNLAVVDTMTASLANLAGARQQTGGAKMAALRTTAGKTTVQYSLMTFQEHLEWALDPRLVRMIPDATQKGYRRPADLKKDKELLQKPVTNIIVLVHGHNEYEKDGSSAPTAEEPWEIEYKWDVWIEFYRAFLESRGDQVECTAFYEFIYPTYRPAYSPLQGGQVDTLGNTLAQALRYGAPNDDYQLFKMIKADMPANLYITAHSMGGLVSREAVRQFDGWLEKNFQQLVTWGSPHRGSPLITLGYLLHGPYMKTGGGKLTTALNLILTVEGPVLNMLYDSLLQLDTPGERDLRWDRASSLRFNEWFAVNEWAIPTGQTAEYYDLDKGDYLYNDNLHALAQGDAKAYGDRYTFLYGVTSKRLVGESYDVSLGGTAIGASLMFALMRDSEAPAPVLGGRIGDSDGAVPLTSMAGLTIAEQHSKNIGDFDHEEYYSHTGDKGGQAARATFDRLGLLAPRCACARVLIESPSNLEGILANSPLEVVAKLKIDPTLDASPGRRVKSAEAFFRIAGTLDEFSLGDLRVADSGELSGHFSMPDLGKGAHKLIVRARFQDGTQLESLPLSKALYTEVFIRLESLQTAACDVTPGYVIDRGFMTKGLITSWTGDGAFIVGDPFSPRDLVALRNVLTGKVSQDGKTVSIWFDYASHWEYPENGSYRDRTVTASLIDIPYVEHVYQDAREYDRFVLEGELPKFARHLTYLGTQRYLEAPNEEQYEVHAYDPKTTCNSRYRAEIWMIISGPNTPR